MGWKEDLIKWLDPALYKRLEVVEKDLSTMKTMHATPPHVRRQ